MTGPLSDQQLDEIRRRDILKGRGEYGTTMTQVHIDRRALLAELDRLRGDLTEMTRCRDNAIRAAERTDQPIEFHLDEQLRDGLAGIAEWEHPGEPDQAPDWLIDAIVRVVRPELARLTEQRDRLVSAFDKLGDQMGEFVQAARSERERYTAENRWLRAELDDVAGYLAATHRHASRHDVLGENLGCAGCALLARIEGTQPAEHRPAVGPAGEGSAA